MLSRAIKDVSRSLAFLMVEKVRAPTTFGSAYAVSTDGHLLTCLHLVEDARSIEARFTAGAPTSAAELIDSEPAADLALLRALDAVPTRAVGIHAGRHVGLGQEVAFMGFPYADLFQPPLVMTIRGIVGNRYSIKGTDYYVIDAMASEGFSGGPLFLGQNGAVCGTVSARFDPLQTRLRIEGKDPARIRADAQRTNLAFAVTEEPALALLRRNNVSFSPCP